MWTKRKASRRTKNRVKEHNLEMIHHPSLRARKVMFDGKPHTLFRCVDHCNWRGWLPIDELEEYE